MKKITALFLLMITVSGLAGFPAAKNASAKPIHNIQITKRLTDRLVYTNDNKTYHRSTCRHHSFNKQIKLKDAQKKNYTPCRVCNP